MQTYFFPPDKLRGWGQKQNKNAASWLSYLLLSLNLLWIWAKPSWKTWLPQLWGMHAAASRVGKSVCSQLTSLTGSVLALLQMPLLCRAIGHNGNLSCLYFWQLVEHFGKGSVIGLKLIFHCLSPSMCGCAYVFILKWMFGKIFVAVLLVCFLPFWSDPCCSLLHDRYSYSGHTDSKEKLMVQ